MEFIVGAIIVSGCIIGGSILANGVITDAHRRRKLSVQRRALLDRLRLEEEEASWRGVNRELERKYDALRSENAALKRKIALKDELLSSIVLKDIEESMER